MLLPFSICVCMALALYPDSALNPEAYSTGGLELNHNFSKDLVVLGQEQPIMINIFTPYLLQIADNGGIEQTLRFDKGLKNGLYYYHGVLTNRSVAEWFDLNYSDINLLIF